ncbi:hypothetical protein [Nostoc sp.]|uniref:hypothetical protein n=1 Tax=Nostoc sp. TaxID=1180 RepID=UPI002FF7A650
MLHWIVSANAKRSQLQFHAFRLCLAGHNINIVNRGSRNKTPQASRSDENFSL